MREPARQFEIRRVEADLRSLLDNIADGVFDNAVSEHLADDFFAQPNHHLIVALAGDVVVGMITGVVYYHPDKPAQLWINEVGVAFAYQKRGIGTQLLQAMLDHGRSLGCDEAWLGTEADNVAARALYERAGASPQQFILYEFDLSIRKVRG